MTEYSSRLDARIESTHGSSTAPSWREAAPSSRR
eukprot:CAMPEP_0119426634 /NCGR_PEP_ID=MMETSP1335-20130426/36711_1 /TAXON_ID=259385 /ORGANISM="Chrysoculter rhomboideus, Strain RCC1486" /LENGTH=33 /DNA_ID= /DNA_START= /DNA_END= /DNA_ORIENTATION=